MSVLIFILILSFLVIIHELGHFIAAKKAGMRVEEFGIGYPPQATQLFKWNETVFSLNWIPFGGFVRIEGEDKAGGSFHRFAIRKRLAVILSGATVNFIFGVVAFSLIFSISGIPAPLSQPRIGQVVAESPAAAAHLPTDVNITGFKINQELIETPSVDEVVAVVETHPGQTVTVITTAPCKQLECLAELSQEYEVYLRQLAETPENQGSMGIVFQSVIYQHYPWYQMPFRGAWYGLMQAFWLGGVILAALRDVFANLITLGQIPQEIAGPVGIVHQASTQGLFSEGWLAVLSFTGMLSINLAVINLLPIPALDGGRAVFMVLEKAVGRQKVERVEHYANYAGYFLLLSLLILVTIRDVIRVFG